MITQIREEITQICKYSTFCDGNIVTGFLFQKNNKM